jgi:hypothetical protein
MKKTRFTKRKKIAKGLGDCCGVTRSQAAKKREAPPEPLAWRESPGTREVLQRRSQPRCLEAGSTARAAGSAGVAGIAGECRIAAGAVAAMLAVVVAILTTSVAIAWRRRGVRRRGRRSGGPRSLPAAAVRLGVEEVHETHRQLDVGALVAVDRVGAPALEQAVHQVPHAAAVLAGEQVAGEDELGVPSVVAGGQLLVQSLQVSKEFFAGLHRSLVVPADISTVRNVVTAWFQEISRQDSQDEDAAVPACRNHSVELRQCGREEGVGGHHQVADHVELLVLLQVGEGDQVAFAVHCLERRIVKAVQDDRDGFWQLAQILSEDGEESVNSCLADCPAAGIHALHDLANVGEGVVQSAGVATADNHRISSRDCLAGSLGHVSTKLSQGEGIRIQIPLEYTAKLREEGVDQNLLVPRAHLREGAAKPGDRVAHHHELSKQLVGSRHLLPLSFLNLPVLRRSAGDHVVPDQLVVGADVPPLDLLEPGGDVDHVQYQVRIIGPAIGRRNKGNDVNGEAEQLGESPDLSTQSLGISHQALLHEVREGSNQQDTALREGKILQQDDCRALPVQRGESGREVLVSEDHKFPPPGPLLLVPLLWHELVVDVAAHADPVRAGEAGGADQQLGRILSDEGLCVVDAAVVFKASTPKFVHCGPASGK